MANYPLLFGCALLLCIVATFRSSEYYKKWVEKKATSSSTAGLEEISDHCRTTHNSLLKRYLFVYLTATLSDWFQGPYVYALYMDYGYQPREIAQLFVAGFGSSMVFGSFVGGMADWGGRRAFVLLFVVVYSLSCITKHFNNYWILMLGRLLGGISTSLLFSIFEAWLIRAHADAELPKLLLSKSFSWAAFGNSIVAILAGLIANSVVGDSTMTQVSSIIHIGGALNPFDLALLALLTCGVGAFVLWEENYGEKDTEPSETREHEGKGPGKWYNGLKDAFVTTMRNREIVLCGIISSLFEGSMYIFVFMWTPLLRAFHQSNNSHSTEKGNDDAESTVPMGLIFATFMVCCMTGSCVFSTLVERHSAESLATYVFGAGAVAMSMVALGINDTVSFVGMNIFEVCVGMYFPIMGTMKGSIVPENKRAAIYNLYRIPLNFIVLTCLLANTSPETAFILNATMLGVATLLQLMLAKRRVESNGRLDSPSKAIKMESQALIDSEMEETASSVDPHEV